MVSGYEVKSISLYEILLLFHPKVLKKFADLIFVYAASPVVTRPVKSGLAGLAALLFSAPSRLIPSEFSLVFLGLC